MDQLLKRISSINQTNSTNGSDVNCIEDVQEVESLVRKYSVPVAIVVIAFLTFFEKRRETGQEQCMGGKPGCLVPVNLLDGDKDRLSYSAAFGCTTSSILNRLLLYAMQQDQSALVIYLSVMLSAIELGIIYYPIFVCLTPTFRFVHPCIGLGYTTIWLVINILYTKGFVECLLSGLPEGWVLTFGTILMSLPQLICLLFLCLKFVYTLVTDIIAVYRACKKERITQSIQNSAAIYKRPKIGRMANSIQLQHVRELFHKADMKLEASKKINFVEAIKLSYKGDQPFKYSPRVTATFTVALLCLYQMAIAFIVFGSYVVFLLEKRLHSLQDSSWSTEIYGYLETLFNVSTVSFYVSFGLATLLSGICIVQILFSYRKNMILLYKGDFSNIPKEVLQQSVVSIMTNNLHYPGNQIAYLFWSYLIMMFVLFLVCIIITYLIVLPILGKVPETFLQPFLTVLSTAAIALVTYYIQYFISKWWLLQDHQVFNNKTNEFEKVLSLQNRKTYHNMSYFLFFYYIFIGLVRCLMRILKAIVLGVAFLGRIDRSGLVQGYEAWDTGYMAYLSFLQMELTHCHPVLVVFCDILKQSLDNKGISVLMYGSISNLSLTNSTVSPSSATEDSGHTRVNVIPRYNRRIHNRWLKAYTLLNNKSLIQENENQQNCDKDEWVEIENVGISTS